MDKLLLRSFLFVPGNNRHYVEKAIKSDADSIIIDMEDSIPGDKKDEARRITKICHDEGLFKNKPTFVRINPIGTKDFVSDISELCLSDIHGFMPSKIKSKEDIQFIDKLLEFMEIKNNLLIGKFFLSPLIETTKAIMNVNEIAFASKRLIALCLGGEDYLNDLGSVYSYQESALAIPRALLVNAARAAGLLPLDTPFLEVSNLELLADKSRLAYMNGFAGGLVIHPKQISTVNKAFSPDKEKTDYAKRIIQELNRDTLSGKKNITVLDGGLIGPPIIKSAENVLMQDELIRKVKAH